MAKRGWRSYLVLAHFPCRSLLAVCLSTIPAAKALLVFAGLESLLSIDHWHLPTALGAAWTRRVTCKSASRHVKQGWWSGTSCSEVHLGKASCSMILKLRERQSCCSCVQPVVQMWACWSLSSDDTWLTLLSFGEGSRIALVWRTCYLTFTIWL